MSKIEGGGGGPITPPPSRLRVTIFSRRILGLTELYFSARWLVRAVLQNWDTRVPTEVESGFSGKIGTTPPNSGRLDTLQGFLGGRPGAWSPGIKKLKFEVFKLLEIH